VSATMLEVLSLAASYAEATEGVFNPFICQALTDCGYNESFEKIGGRRDYPLPAAVSAAATAAFSLTIDPFMKAVTFPRGASIDLGGIVKSWAASRLAAYLKRNMRIGSGFINAGGDLTSWNDSPIKPASAPGRKWRLGIEHPFNPERNAGVLLLSTGAAATSGTLGRHWPTSRGTMHHLVDPFTRLPSRSDVVQCTVAGEDAVACEIWAKTLCILGSELGMDLLASRNVPCEAAFFTAEGTTGYFGSSASLGKRWAELHIDHHFPYEGGVQP